MEQLVSLGSEFKKNLSWIALGLCDLLARRAGEQPFSGLHMEPEWSKLQLKYGLPGIIPETSHFSSARI